MYCIEVGLRVRIGVKQDSHARLNSHNLALPELCWLPGAWVGFLGIVLNGSCEGQGGLRIVSVYHDDCTRADS